MTNITLEQAVENAKEQATRFNNKYILSSKVNKMDMCGMAVPLIQFGRKRKLKQEADDYLESEWDRYGKKHYVFAIPEIKRLSSQNYDYNEGFIDVIVTELNKYYQPLGVKVFTHSWVD